MSGSSVGRIGLGIVGGVVGAFFGNPFLGYAAGSLLGATLFPGDNSLPGISQEGPKLGDLRVQLSSYGRPLPIAFGNVRIAGTVIWAQPIQQHTVTQTQTVESGGGGGKGGHPPSQDVTTTTYTYTVSLAISLCEGPILGIRRIWANGELIYDVGNNASYATYIQSQSLATAIRFYAGDETQLQDPLILATEGTAPAYRGVAYLVFESLQLGRWNNSVPNMEFEVVTQGSSSSSLPILDDPNEFGIGANGSITPDGLLLITYMSTISPLVTHLVLADPFDLSIIREYNPNGYLAGHKVHPHFAPRINGYGDILFNDENQSYYFWPPNGTPVLVSVDQGTRSWMDGSGNFYFVGRVADSRAKLVRIDAQTGVINVLRDYGTTIPKDSWDSHDGYIWVATSASPNGSIEKVNRSTGQVVSSFATNATPHSVTVAGDGSVWYLNGATSNVKLWRVSPDLTSETKLYDAGGTHTAAAVARLSRDWSNGDVLYADAFLKRYNEDGTLVETLIAGTEASVVDTDPAFQDRIYTFGNAAIGIATQFIHAWRALSVASSTTTVGDTVTAICERSGLSAAYIDVSALTQTLRGYVIANRTSGRDALQQLMTAFLFDAVESNGKLKFVVRGAASAATITENDLGARVDAGQGDAYSVSRQQETELPHEIAISYLDVGADYLVGTQYARRLVGQSSNDQSMSLAVVLSADEARQIAETILYEAWIAREQTKASVSTKWAKLEPTDPITVTLNDGTTLSARITKVIEGQGIRELDLLGYEPSVYSQSTAGAALPVPQSSPGALSATTIELMDTALLRDTDDTYGVYLAACGYTDNWPGMKLFKSTDSGVTYVDSGVSIPSAVPMGYTLTKLANWTGGNFFDEANTVDVSVLGSSLSSTTEANVLNGSNACFLGGEILQFKNATLIADQKYRLSGLLRGRLGTEWAMSRHSINQPFVLLNQSLLRVVTTPAADQNVARDYKGVTFGTATAQAAPRRVSVQSNRLKPLSPVQVGGGRNSNTDVLVNWKRRARKAGSWIDYADVPLDETAESYEVDVFAGSGKTILAISLALDGIITAVGHGFVVADVVHITGVAGMTPVNDRTYTVATVPDANSFTVSENTSGYSAYTSGGTARKRARTLTASTTTTTYTIANQTTDYGGAQATVYAAVQQISARIGRGYAGVAVI